MCIKEGCVLWKSYTVSGPTPISQFGDSYAFVIEHVTKPATITGLI